MKLPPLGKALFSVAAALALPVCAFANENKLTWGENCSFAYTDGKPFEGKLTEHACDYLANNSGAEQQAFNDAKLEQQKRMLEDAAKRAEALKRSAEQERDAALAKADASSIPADAKHESLMRKVSDMKSTLTEAKAKLSSNLVVKGAKARGRDQAYIAPLDARLRELDGKLTGARADVAKKDDALRKKAQERLAKTPDNNSTTGRLNTSADKLKGGTAEAASKEMFDGNTRGDRRLKHTGATGDPKGLQLHDAAAPAIKPAHVTSYNRDKIPEMALDKKPEAGHGAAAAHGADAHGAPKKDGEGWYVKKALGKAEAKLETVGTNMMISANEHDNKAQQALKTASDACSKGSTWDCAKAKASGYTSYVGHKAADYGNTAGAFGVASAEGLTRGLQNKGPEAKILKWGAVGVATIATGGVAAGVVGGAAATGAAASATTVAFSAATGGLVAHGVAGGVQTIGSADNGKQAALGAVEIGLSAASPAIGKGIGHVAGKFIPTAASEAMTGAAARGASAVLGKAATVAESSVVGRVAANGLTAAAESAGHWAPHVVTHAAEHGAAIVVEKQVHAGAGWALDVEHH